MLLANAVDVRPATLSFKIADIYLKDRLQPTPDKPSLGDKPEITIDPKVLDAYVGDYQLRPGVVISFSKDNDHLVARATGQSSFPMYAVSNTAFRGEREDIFRTRQSSLERHLPWLDAQWSSGCRNGADLWRASRSMGFEVLSGWSPSGQRGGDAQRKQMPSRDS